MAISCIVCEL